MRKKDVPCAGGCGCLVWRGKGCLPPGEAKCRACRRRDRFMACVICGKSFERSRPLANSHASTTCSPECRRERFDQVAAMGRAAAGREIERPCPDCGTPILGRYPTKRCPACAAVRIQRSNRVKNVRRRGARVTGRTLTLPELAERDRWTCHLCRKRVDSSLKSPHPRSATFDHLIPIAEDGTDAPENLRLAHRECNTRRGTGGVVQLLLLG